MDRRVDACVVMVEQGPNVVLLGVGGEVVGMDWWYVQGDVAQGHLAAFNELGYDVLASYATKWYAMEYFATRVRWMNLGGAPGTMDTGIDGLTRFKRGWTSDTRKAYFCGRILNAELYGSLCEPLAQGDTSYFPAYRRGEFD